MELFVHITGSVPRKSGSDAIELAKRTAYETARALLREKIGVVALAGGTPNEKTMPFDDEIIKAAADHLADTNETGILIRTVRHQSKWTNQVSDSARENLRLLAKRVYDESIPGDEYFGGEIRDAQAELADGAVVIGGSIGVKHIASLLIDSCPPKPVDEIFVKGLDGGLPPDMRARIDESRDWDSKADIRTVHEEKDCDRIAYAVASNIACRLRKREAVVQSETGQRSVDAKTNIWHYLNVGQIPNWLNAGINAIRLWLSKEGAG